MTLTNSVLQETADQRQRRIHQENELAELAAHSSRANSPVRGVKQHSNR